MKNSIKKDTQEVLDLAYDKVLDLLPVDLFIDDPQYRGVAQIKNKAAKNFLLRDIVRSYTVETFRTLAQESNTDPDFTESRLENILKSVAAISTLSQYNLSLSQQSKMLESIKSVISGLFPDPVEMNIAGKPYQIKSTLSGIYLKPT